MKHCLLIAFALIGIFVLTTCEADKDGGMDAPMEFSSEEIVNTASLTQANFPLLLNLTPSTFELDQGSMTATSPAQMETRRLILQWPGVIYTGDAGIVQLRLEINEKEDDAVNLETRGQTTGGQAAADQNIYQTHNLVAAARLEMVGVKVSPPEMIYQPLRPGESLTFYWSLQPDSAAMYRGLVWFYLQFVSKTDGSITERTISAQVIEIRVESILGLNAKTARVLGFTGLFLSILLGWPFLEDSLHRFFMRLRKGVELDQKERLKKL